MSFKKVGYLNYERWLHQTLATIKKALQPPEYEIPQVQKGVQEQKK